MQRSSSAIDAFTSCMGSVPSPAAKRFGHERVISLSSSLIARELATATGVSS
jgi:hypothetical protein